MLEPPGSDGLRSAPPWLEATAAGRGATSALHEYLNAGKRSVSIDPGSESLDALLAWADVVITSADGEVDWVHRLHDRVQRANAAAVHVVVSGYGLSGPYCR